MNPDIDKNQIVADVEFNKIHTNHSTKNDSVALCIGDVKIRGTETLLFPVGISVKIYPPARGYKEHKALEAAA
ncbi:MAG: hypothetical protein JZU65_05420 [Chlorobium sp.]|nr:hypothetical protein [Chlorobium sp.]